jgi:hypothetical protein
MTLSAASRIGHRAASETRRSSRRRRLALAALALVSAAIVSSVLALVGSGSPTAVVPHGVRTIEIRSGFPRARPAASYSITDAAKVGRITALLNGLYARRTTYDGSYGLGVAGIGHNQMCLGVAGPTANLELLGAGGTVLASASFVTGDGLTGLSAACNPLWFGRGRTAVSGGKVFHPQFALAGHDLRQSNFAEKLEHAIGRPLCQRDVGASAQYCKP